MGAGGCTDGDSVQATAQQGLDVGHGLEAELLGHSLGTRVVEIRDDDLFNAVKALQRRRVECTDPANANQPDAHAQPSTSFTSARAMSLSRCRLLSTLGPAGRRLLSTLGLAGR